LHGEDAETCGDFEGIDHMTVSVGSVGLGMGKSGLDFELERPAAQLEEGGLESLARVLVGDLCDFGDLTKGERAALDASDAASVLEKREPERLGQIFKLLVRSAHDWR